MTEHLHWCRDARNRHAANLARDKALGRIAERPTARLGLNPASFRVEGHRVEVELLALAPEHDPNWEMVFVQGEAERPKGFVDERDVGEANDQIEVFVRSGFASQQRIDTPPTVKDRADAGRFENGQDFEDAVGSHSSSLGAA
jgi:hypothetical protein